MWTAVCFALLYWTGLASASFSDSHAYSDFRAPYANSAAAVSQFFCSITYKQAST
jgi:hypothetical protein